VWGAWLGGAIENLHLVSSRAVTSPARDRDKVVWETILGNVIPLHLHQNDAGSKWACPQCHFILPCCEGGELAGLPATRPRSGALTDGAGQPPSS